MPRNKNRWQMRWARLAEEEFRQELTMMKALAKEGQW